MLGRRTTFGVALGLLAACSGAPEGSPRQPNAKVAKIDVVLPSTTFGFISGLGLGSDGRLYVSDFRGGVSVYSSDGTPVFVVGRQGAGPGDLSMPCCVDISSDGQLWVSEVGNRRYSVFDVTGPQPVYQWAIPSGGSGVLSLDRVQRNAGSGVFQLTSVQGGPQAGLPIVVTLDSTGVVIRADTLPPPRAAITPLTITKSVAGGTSTQRMATPFGASRLTVVGPGFYADAVSTEYRVEVVRLDGGPSTVLQKRVPSVEISSRELDSARASVDEWLKAVNASPADIQLPSLTTKPALQAIGVDHDGRIWVQRSTPDGTPSVADVYRADGTQVATMQWPQDVQLLSWAVRGSVGIGVRNLDSGEVSIVRLVWE